MTTSQRSRHEMIVALQDHLGTEAAMTLVEHLPPEGWADVATRHDIQRLDQRLDTIETRILGQLDQRLAAQTRSIMVAFVTALIGFGGLLVAAVALAR